MPTRDGYAEGTPCWVDLATPDVEHASDFYGRLLGWEFEPVDMGSEYLMAMRKGLAAAGIGAPADPEDPAVWSTYFAVDDADLTVERIEGAGGNMRIGPSQVADLGRVAFARDPTGGDFGIWQAGRHFGAAIVNEHGGLNWNELVTEEPDRALDFYATVFDHGTETATTPGGREYSMLKVGSREVAGVIASRKPGHRSEWAVYFAIDDAASTAGTATKTGGKVTFGPIEQPDVGTFVGLEDPMGTRFTVIQLANEID